MDRYRGLDLFFVGLGIMSVLIGAGVFLGIFFNHTMGIIQGLSIVANWLWVLFLLFIFIAFMSFVFRVPFPNVRGRWTRKNWWLGGSDADEIVRERYARGELTKEEFDQMMSDLSRNRS